MEASNQLQVIQNYVNTPSIEVSPAKTIKMEDITSSSSSQSLVDLPSADSSKGAKPAKKRKSWGQVLPEPKTNLPPRKRAKTADEKEQRRIERVKRNRLAAHNSRERKRAEVEALQERNDQLQHHMQRMQEIIDCYKQQCPNIKVPTLPKFEYKFSAPATTPSYPTPPPSTISTFITEMPHKINASYEIFARRYSAVNSRHLIGREIRPDTTICCVVVRPAVSVGFFTPIDLGGNEDHGKLHLDANLDHGIQFHDFTEDGNMDFDFPLYPQDNNSFFSESFDGSVTREGLFGGDSADAFELLDGKFPDLQPGVGALNKSCDAL